MDINSYLNILYDLQTLILEDPGGSILPNSKEIEEYANHVGIDTKSEPYLLQLAIEGFMMELPLFWKPCWDGINECIYYFNFKTGESVWEHPFDSYFQSVLPKLRAKQKMGLIVESIKPVFYDFVMLKEYQNHCSGSASKSKQQHENKLDSVEHENSIQKKYLTLPSNYRHAGTHQRSKSLHDGIYSNEQLPGENGKLFNISAHSDRAQGITNSRFQENEKHPKARSKSISDINEPSKKMLFMDQVIHDQCSQLTQLIKENHVYSTKYQMLKEKFYQVKAQLSQHIEAKRLSGGLDPNMCISHDASEDQDPDIESDSSGNAFHEDLQRSRSSVLNKTKQLLTDDRSLNLSEERLLRDIHYKTDKACARLSQVFACLKSLESDIGLLLSTSLTSEFSESVHQYNDTSSARRGILVSMRGLDMGLNYLRSDLLEISYKVRDNLRFTSSRSDYIAEQSYEMSVSDKIEEQRQWLNAIKCQTGISSTLHLDKKYDQSK